MKKFALLGAVLSLPVLVLAGDPPARKSVPPADNVGITLPKGFAASVLNEGVGKARHAVVAPNGDLYVKLDRLEGGKGIVRLRDTNGDGRADVTSLFGTFKGTGIGIANGYLYASSDTSVYRFPMKGGVVDETAQPETIVTGLTLQRAHAAKSIALDDAGHLYVNFGAPSNACQSQDRTKGSPGQDPCPLLQEYGGIWQFDANKKNQRQSDGTRYATGIRNAVALDWNPVTKQLYALQHGRDQLSTLFPDLFTNEQSAELPAEEFLLVRKGADFGWPYCYYDEFQNKKVLAPEYGGDGKKQDRCAQKEMPIMAFPGHWAPNDVLFYTGNQFPARYKNGAFICFHGSWNRAPLKQGGYFVAFVPMGKDGKPSGPYEPFAEGFAGGPDIMSPGDAVSRPVGLAQGPDGSLYITDSVKGKIWKVRYGK